MIHKNEHDSQDIDAKLPCFPIDSNKNFAKTNLKKLY